VAASPLDTLPAGPLLTVESALIARIKATVPALEVIPYPDDPRYYKLSHPVGAILVIFREEVFGPSKSTDAVIQDRELVFELVIQVRNLRDHFGLYRVIDALWCALLGWQAYGCKRATGKRGAFQHLGDGVWQWGLFVSIGTVAVEEIAPGAAGDVGMDLPDGSANLSPAPLLKEFTSYSELPP